MAVDIVKFLLVVAGGVAIMLATVALERAWGRIGTRKHPGDEHIAGHRS